VKSWNVDKMIGDVPNRKNSSSRSRKNTELYLVLLPELRRKVANPVMLPTAMQSAVAAARWAMTAARLAVQRLRLEFHLLLQ
jgi:hypothetical protein